MAAGACVVERAFFMGYGSFEMKVQRYNVKVHPTFGVMGF